jgi:hypothetical protein
MGTDVFQKRLGSPSFAKLMRKNVGTSFFCTQQYLACNAKHSTLARCARWLLMTADRASRTQFTLNRDFLGIMLSVHEEEMYQTIDELTRRGAITYARADVTIVDVQLLEQISCGCYAVCKAAFAKSLLD